MSAIPTDDRKLNKQPPILRLPDELLEPILEDASTGYGSWGYSPSDGLRRCANQNVQPAHKAFCLPLVCRRFYSIFQPLLYRHVEICLGPRSRLCADRLASLYATLRGNSTLARSCHTIMIEHFNGEALKPEQYVEVFRGLLSLTTNLRCLKLVAFPPDIRPPDVVDGPGPLASLWERLAAINHVMLIDVMHEGEGYGLADNMMRSRSNLCDRALQLYGYVPISRADVVHLTEDTAPFTTVDIGDFSDDVLILSSIVNWCKTIEHFAYSEYYDGGAVAFPADDDQTFFHWLLARHRGTVRSLAIGYFHRLPGRPLDVTDLPALETLAIRWPTFTANTRYNIGGLGATEAADALLAPNLRHLTLVMEIFLGCPGGTHGTALNRWLEQFMEIARQRRSPLQRIRVVYDGRREGCRDDCKFPQNVMSPLFEAAKRLDFTLVFEKETNDSWL